VQTVSATDHGRCDDEDKGLRTIDAELRAVPEWISTGAEGSQVTDLVESEFG